MANCRVTTTATDANSNSAGECSVGGSVVTVETTKGSTASGSDTMPPTCTPKKGGTAKVTSPMGNCG